MSVTMRAKFVVSSVAPATSPGGCEVLYFNAVGGSKVSKEGYPQTGEDEDNTYARWSPSGHLNLQVANPNLHGKFKAGDKFYLDFTPVPEPIPVSNDIPAATDSLPPAN